MKTEIIDGKFENGNDYRIIKEENGNIRLIVDDADRQKIKTKNENFERMIRVESFSYPVD
jgi:hypothetical protein